jgi:hypothetical protein
MLPHHGVNLLPVFAGCEIDAQHEERPPVVKHVDVYRLIMNPTSARPAADWKHCDQGEADMSLANSLLDGKSPLL